MSRGFARALPPRRKLRLGVEVVRTYVSVRLALARGTPLPELVERLQASPPRPTDDPPLHPRRLGRLVARVLRLGPVRARCLTSSLVLLRLLTRQATAGELVIGLPKAGDDPYGHAWVEVRGFEVGPPPGRAGHRELIRYGAEKPARQETAAPAG